MATIVWPREELPPRAPRFDPAYRNVSGAAARYGLDQVVASDAGVWKATFSEIIVHQQSGKQRIELWDAIAGLVEGRANALLMPVDVSGRRPLPDGVADDDIDYEAGIPHDDDSFFDDDTGYLNGWIEVTAAAALRRATTLVLTKTVCGTIRPGMRFSIEERLYQVKTVVSQTDSAATITINFPLRDAVAAGSRCEFARPVCRMRLITDGEMDLPLQLENYAFPSIGLVEALP